MRLTILGCGDAFSSGGRYQSCYLLETGVGRILIDCGATASLAMQRAGIVLDKIDGILISHLHGDHIGGLPFLYVDGLYKSRRSRPLPVAGPAGSQARITALIEIMYPGVMAGPPFLDVPFTALIPGQPLHFQNLKVLPAEVRHPSGAPSLGLRIEAEGKVFAYSGDTGWCDSVAALGRDADLYLIECSTYATQRDMHLDYLTIASNFSNIGAQRYLLTHMSDEMLANADKIDAEKCIAARDGMIIDI